MEKKQFIKLFKDYMKKCGFIVKGNFGYMMVDHDYRISVLLDHHPFEKAYSIGYGVKYEVQKTEILSRRNDWTEWFSFCVDHNDDLAQYSIGDIEQPLDRSKLVDYCKYEDYTEEELVRAMDLNFEKCVRPVFDKERVLDHYRNDWIRFRRIPYDTVRKISRLAGLDAEKVIEIRDSNVTKWPV